MRSSATTPGGCLRRSASSFATFPVSSSSRIFSAVLLPIPAICWSSFTVSAPMLARRARRSRARPSRRRARETNSDRPRRAASARRDRAACRARPASCRPSFMCSLLAVAEKEPPEVLAIDGREVRITHPSKPYFTRADAALEARRRPLLPLGRRRRAARDPRSPDRAEALRGRRRGRGVLPEARAGEAPRVAAHGDARVSVGAHRRGGGGRRRGGARLDREPRLPRAASASGALGLRSSTPTSCAWISIRGPASRGRTCAAWRSR